MFMRYRGGGIGHEYMREIEDRFEDMRREQVDPDGAPQAVQLSQDGDDSAGEPLAGVAVTTDSTGNTPMADSDDGGHFEEEISGDEWPETCPTEDDYLSGEDDEEDNEDDGTGEGAYGMAEY